MPKLSVLLPVRDAAPWLGSSLASLARQTLTDFEIVAVDDGSRDGSGEILERWALREPRLRVLHTAPRGLPRALQTALEASRGRLIARQDADDLSHRRRFELQADCLARHSGAAVVGCRVRLFPAASTGPGMRRWIRWHNALLTHEAMAAEALIDSPLAHGTALMRREWLERVGGWRERGWAEDLDLWLRLLATGAIFAKCSQTLYGWRQHPGSATRRDARYARDRFVALKCEALGRGLLRRVRDVRLVGTGESLRRWRMALEAAGYRVDARALPRPGRSAPRDLVPPVLLVFGAPEARVRWRSALSESGMQEMREFMFIA